MNSQHPSKDKLLFTPGPLTTSLTVKQAMLRDLGSRDSEFIQTVKEVRRWLVALSETVEANYSAILMQGSGTFGIESVIGSTIPPHGKLLVLVNGAYGRRIAQIATMLKIDHSVLNFAENEIVDPATVDAALAADASLTDVAVIHCETTTGIINPVEKIGEVVKKYDCCYIVDAMSSFGAVPLNIEAANIDFLVSSANKCIEGVPGFSFVIARRFTLAASRGYARSISLDLFAQWEGLENTGQFRFTPPTHAILAYHQALLELEAEGGIAGRAARYRENYETCLDGMQALGFKTYLDPQNRGYIITSFLYPQHENFDFTKFYELLSDKGFVIYPGKLSKVDCFRIGHVGRIYPEDVRDLLDAVRETLTEMNVSLLTQ
jgi:2-aminoethylphosphonate-pyruvate transaminase